MKLALSTESWKLNITDLKLLSRNFGADDDLKYASSSIILVSSASRLIEYDTDFLFEYDVFPRFIMTAQRQWQLEARQVRLGDVIIQRLFIPPLGRGICIECAVRVCTLENNADKIGFGYETLPGHVEKGLSEFYVHEQDGDICFNVRTHSAPGHWLSRTMRPVARWYQTWCTHQALLHVKRRFEAENSSRKCRPNLNI
jgi:Domain of unknown function (DUF1990)